MSERVKPNVHVAFFHQLDECRAAVGFEVETLHTRPDPDLLLVELIHAVSRWNCLITQKVLPVSGVRFPLALQVQLAFNSS